MSARNSIFNNPRRSSTTTDGRSDRFGFEEKGVRIIDWEGMKSAYPSTAISVKSFTNVLNKEYVNPQTLSTRQGASILYMHQRLGYVVAAYEFNQSNSNSVLVMVTKDGRLLITPTVLTPNFWKLGQTGPENIPPQFTQVGYLTTGNIITSVSFAIFKNRLYITDGYNAWYYDPSTSPSIVKINSTIAASAGAYMIDVLSWGSRLWFLTSTSELRGSNINDPSDFTSGNAWNVLIGDNDGTTTRSMIVWGRSIVITKSDTVTNRRIMYKLQGFSTSTFRVDKMFGNEKSPVGFVGKSAVEIGNDVIGLTYDGFVAVSAVDTFQEAALNSLSTDIDDIIQRINFNNGEVITAIYDLETKQYMCAVPLDNDPYNTIILIYDIRSKRWGYYNNWPVLNFFYVKGKTAFVGNTSNLYSFNFYDHDNTEGNLITVNTNFSTYYSSDTGTEGLTITPTQLEDSTEVEINVLYGSSINITNNNFLFLCRRGQYYTDDVFDEYTKHVEGPDVTFDEPDTTKVFKSIDINLTQENDYFIEVTTTIDSNDNRTQSQLIEMNNQGSRIDEFIVDVDKVDIQPNTSQTVGINSRGRTIRVGLKNSEKNQFFSLRGMTYRYFTTDSGQAISDGVSVNNPQVV